VSATHSGAEGSHVAVPASTPAASSAPAARSGPPLPSAPVGTALRISHAERDPVVDRLKEAFAQGRLDKTELDCRLDLALSARTHADLAGLLDDLPGGHSPAAVTPEMPVAVRPDGQARMWAAVGHLTGIATSFVGPMALYVLADRRKEHVRRHLAEAANFQLTLLLVTIVTFGLGGIVYAVAWVVALVAAIQAITGERFRYPLTLRLLR
jgi:uncharacterized Tic20 family protein